MQSGADERSDPCPHLDRADGRCLRCGVCTHEVVLNGVCYFCGEVRPRVTVKPAGDGDLNVVSVDRIRRRTTRPQRR